MATSVLPLLYALLALNVQNVATPKQQQNAVTPPPAGETRASISGTVRDASTGAPIEDVLVSVRAGAKYETTKTGLNGRYSIRGLESGRYALEARWKDATGVAVTRMITLRPGQELDGADVRLAKLGIIAGIVADEKDRRLSGVTVSARWSCYFQGVLQPCGLATTTTDDRGEYRLQGLKPGRAYFVAAGVPQPVQVAAGSGATTSAKSAWERLYYPNSPLPEGAIAISLLPGEVREAADFRMRTRPAFCVSGVVNGASAEGAGIEISTADRSPGWSVQLGRGITDSSGRFSACGLPPGAYRAVGKPSLGFSLYGVGLFQVSDRNVRNIVVDLQHPMEIRGELRWADTPPRSPVSQAVRIVLMPAERGAFSAESLRAASPVPGEFAFPGVFRDRYTLKLYDLPAGVYAKEIRYGAIDALRSALDVGAAPPGEGLRITLSHDGGALRVLATDRERRPVQDAGICVFPVDAGNVADLARYYVPYGTDQDGYRTIGNLAPGRYYVLATTQSFDPTHEVLTRILQARSKAEEVQVTSGQTRDVTLEIVELR